MRESAFGVSSVKPYIGAHLVSCVEVVAVWLPDLVLLLVSLDFCVVFHDEAGDAVVVFAELLDGLLGREVLLVESFLVAVVV